MNGSNGAERMSGCVVSGDFFGVLRVNAAIGRTIQPADDVPNGAKIVVLSNQLWRTRFGSDPNIVGTWSFAVAPGISAAGRILAA